MAQNLPKIWLNRARMIGLILNFAWVCFSGRKRRSWWWNVESFTSWLHMWRQQFTIFLFCLLLMISLAVKTLMIFGESDPFLSLNPRLKCDVFFYLMASIGIFLGTIKPMVMWVFQNFKILSAIVMITSRSKWSFYCVLIVF